MARGLGDSRVHAVQHVFDPADLCDVCGTLLKLYDHDAHTRSALNTGQFTNLKSGTFGTKTISSGAAKGHGILQPRGAWHLLTLLQGDRIWIRWFWPATRWVRSMYVCAPTRLSVDLSLDLRG